MENEHEIIKRSIFDNPVDLFNFNQIKPAESPSLSYAKMMQASSHSVPASRRNSSDDHALDLLLNAKLSLNDTESSRKLPFAMTSQETFSTFSEPEIPLFNPLLSHSKESPMHSFASVVTPRNSNVVNSAASTVSDDYPELFTMTNLDNKPTIISKEPSFLHDNQTTTTTTWISTQPSPPVMTSLHQTTEYPAIEKCFPYLWPPNNRPQSRFDPMIDQSETPCAQFQQVGFCSRLDTCPFIHSYPTMHYPQQPSLYQQYMSNPISSQILLPQSNKSLHHHHKRQHQPQDHFSNANIDDFVGKLYNLCKDQNGCRFLQKQIEDKEQGAKHLDMIFKEIHHHLTELMTDPFGNYLCQKILERCSHEQRTIIVETVAPDLVKIALNMHGTRAVQKLIECLSTSKQIKAVTRALDSNVVTLIKDLNGNHVIQKCLHRLSSENNQFIYDAVCQDCIEVASHKHGCCVLQRCFDHATVSQKNQLVKEISRHALPLVQNPFGNYVVQYVLELGIPRYSESVTRRFVGHVCTLSVQKFSSNVIENCIRTAEPSTRRLLIAELINPDTMEQLLNDSFANYVIQTSLDFADDDQRIELVECIRPLLPTIRSTPYGKRIHSKIFKETKINACNKPHTIQHRQRHKHMDSTSPVISQ
ncbi:armadillo-type protein [Gilbertella persicaria]|uniref:armadillo-type protein n=1 Tax=Gilbertella persicaria TaxID=101096 RepID=UPI002220BD85|nr:armadillo-type protein [Gilbertella persicaria]KAI8064339.1 armadillo-type protein [Gilbertella persicaria]